MGRSTRVRSIEALARELQAQITAGVLSAEIGDQIEFSFVVPASKTFPNGGVVCSFRTMAVSAHRPGQEGSDFRLTIS